MTVKKCWEVPACPEEKREMMIKEMEGYLNANLKRCRIVTEAEGSAYTTSCMICPSGKKGKEPVVVLIRMSFSGAVCKVDFEYNINRVVFNFIFAAATLFLILPACIFFATAIIRLRECSKMGKGLEEIMRKYTV